MAETGTAVAVHQGGGAVIDYNADRLALLKRTIANGTTDDEFALFVEVCKRSGLDPFSKQIYMIPRGTGNKRTITVQTGIDGFRAIAVRSGKYEGQIGPQWCGFDGVWRDVWLEEEPPAAARVGIYRTGFQEPVWGVATWKSYAVYEAVWEGPQGNRVKTNKTKLSDFWERMAPEQLAKCAEGIGLRKAFPVEISGIYTSDEMQQADNDDSHLGRVVDPATGEVVNDPGSKASTQAASGARRGTPPANAPKASAKAAEKPATAAAPATNPVTDMARTAFAAVKAVGVTQEQLQIFADDTNTLPVNGGMIPRWLELNEGKDMGDWIRQVIDRFAKVEEPAAEGEVVDAGAAPEARQAEPTEPDPDDLPYE